MLNSVLKLSFATIGSFTGITLTRTFFVYQFIGTATIFKVIAYIVISITAAFLFYSASNKIIDIVIEYLDKLELFLHKMTLYELLMCSVGLIIGLIIANLVSIPFNKIPIFGSPICILTNICFGCLGIVIVMSKKNENIFDLLKGRDSRTRALKNSLEPKIDTSVIIDGRIVDICRSGFLEGTFIIPSFILEELRHIADSTDILKRNRGRRGLDVLNILQRDLELPVKIENYDITAGSEADSELLKMAKMLGGKVLTIDYNLNKVALIQGVQVLNINELANAVKPIALPGEDMMIQVIKDGKENGQGIRYLDDGTMIVIEGGRRHIGENLNVTVTSILQTAAGRMIFAKPKYAIERVI